MKPFGHTTREIRGRSHGAFDHMVISQKWWCTYLRNRDSCWPAVWPHLFLMFPISYFILGCCLGSLCSATSVDHCLYSHWMHPLLSLECLCLRQPYLVGGNTFLCKRQRQSPFIAHAYTYELSHIMHGTNTYSCNYQLLHSWYAGKCSSCQK